MNNDEQGSEMYAALIGEKRRDYYLKRFESFDDRGGGINSSWNWAAFFFTGLWVLYRKMYADFFALLGIAFISGLIIDFLLFDSPLTDLIFNVLWYFGFGIYGNALYYRHTTRKIATARTTLPDAEKMLSYIQSKGGVHVWVIWLFLIIPLTGILAAIFIPAYQDYTIRAQVSEGLNLTAACKAAVTEYYRDQATFPNDNTTAGLEAAINITGKYTTQVTVGAGGTCSATYGNDANSNITDAVLTMTPTDNEGSISWECSGDATLVAKWLPAACRWRRAATE